MDKNRLVIIILILSFLFMSPAYALDWDVLDEDCSSLSGWTDSDDAGCESTQETFQGEETFKLYAPTTAAEGNLATRDKKITIPDTCTVEWRAWLSSASDYGALYIQIRTSSGHVYPIKMEDDSNHFVAWDKGTNGWHHIKTGDIFGRWITFRMVIKSGRKVDLWIDNRIYHSNVVADKTDSYDSGVYLYTAASSDDDAIGYFDYVKIDTTPEAPTTESALKIHDENIALRLAQSDETWVDEPVDIFRIQAKPYEGQPVDICGIPLVDTGDANASKTRIYDGSATKALMKIPE